MTSYFRLFVQKCSMPITEMVGIGLCTLWFMNNIATLRTAYGPSMEPTIYSNNILLTEHLSARLHRLKKGDVVIFKNPYDPKQLVCKRIVGVAGDYIQHGSTANFVPPGHVWVEGDNKKCSQDSRAYGPVPKGLITSRVLLRAFPISIMDNLLLL